MIAESVFDRTESVAHPFRILVVEDERIVARSLRKQLSALGYIVTDCVATGEESIRQSEQDPADLILMDIKLDGPMDGVDAAAVIRKRFHIPVVFLTAYSNKEILDRAKVTEPFGYILKPYDDRDLHVVIETGLYRHRMEERLRHGSKMEAIGQFAGGMAHAVNNLMTAVLGYSSMMLDEIKPGDRFSVYLEEIRRSARRTVSLTKKLMVFGRKQSFALAAIDVNAVLKIMAPLIRRIQANVRLELELDSNVGLAWSEMGQLEETILTLVHNACQSMPNGGRLTIGTANVELDRDHAKGHPPMRAGPYVLMAVSDDGIGMDRRSISRVFEPFFTESAAVGAGLGLAVAYGFVRQCGGDIDVQSECHKGTTFRLYFPRQVELPEMGSS